MKKVIATLALAALTTAASYAQTTLADWTFEGTLNDTTASDFAYGPADSGAQNGGSAGGGHHAATNTVWSSPSGNGSVQSLSATRWDMGDYFQFSLSTAGFSGLSITADQTGSNTGPRDFQLQYSTDGNTFTNFGSIYSISNDSWATNGTPKTVSNHSFDLSSITALNNLSTVYFRLTDASTTNITGGAITAAGSSRVDNFTVNAANTVVPEPSILGLAGLGAAMLVGARRFYRRSRG